MDSEGNGAKSRMPSLGRGGLGFDPRKTAILFIEVQNEFMTPGGKLYESVRPVMEEINMVANCVRLVKELRDSVVKVMFAPISFSPDSSDNPNRHLGILSGIDYDELFIRGSWNAQISELMLDPDANNDDVVVIQGKRGLSAFPNTDLEEQLKKHGIDTIALAGFMANCCVESTMRDAFDRGYNVVTLADCVATTTIRGYKSCVEITYPFFSTPMNCDSFLANVRTAMKFPETFKVQSLRNVEVELNTPAWACRKYSHEAFYDRAEMTAVEGSDSQSVYQVGPWFVDVRTSAIGEKVILRSGEQELKRYLAMAECTGGFDGKSYWEPGCDCIYKDKLERLQSGEVDIHDSEEAFGWYCNMVVVRLPEGGCLVYSPVLGPDSSIESVQAEFAKYNLLPVRVVVVPTPQHHLAIAEYQRLFPEAFYICGKASGQMQSLTKKRRDLRFDGKLRPPGRVCDGVSINSSLDKTQDSINLFPIMEPSEIPLSAHHPSGGGYEELLAVWSELASSSENNANSIFDVCILDDNRTGEIVLLHKPSKTLIVSDLLYKSCRDIVGPGGVSHNYSAPEWFAKGQDELFYDPRMNIENASVMDSGEANERPRTEPSVRPLLPSYRTHPKARTIDTAGLKMSLERILAWDFKRCLACHTDPIAGDEARKLIKQAWGFVWEC